MRYEVGAIWGSVWKMCGRAGEFNVLAEPEFSQPPVGQIILEQLSLTQTPPNVICYVA